MFPQMFLGEVTAVSATDFTSILETLQSQISVGTIVTVITAALGAGVGLAFMWWGVRKLIASLMKSFRDGRLGV